MGQEFDAAKMKKAIGLRPKAIAQINFLERTESGGLRTPTLVRLQDNKDARNVMKETFDGV
jgi:hypothetical protein